jgi:hypothetical protein
MSKLRITSLTSTRSLGVIGAERRLALLLNHSFPSSCSLIVRLTASLSLLSRCSNCLALKARSVLVLCTLFYSRVCYILMLRSTSRTCSCL